MLTRIAYQAMDMTNNLPPLLAQKVIIARSLSLRGSTKSPLEGKESRRKDKITKLEGFDEEEGSIKFQIKEKKAVVDQCQRTCPIMK